MDDTIVKRLPAFESEEEELRFWDEHDPADYIEGPSDVVISPRCASRRPTPVATDGAGEATPEGGAES